MATPSTPSVNLNLVLEQVAKDKGIDAACSSRRSSRRS